jgi:hypothetical protein
MKKLSLVLILFSFLNLSLEITPKSSTQHFIIVGGGIIGAMEAFFGFTESKKNNIPLKITIYEKNTKVSDTTACNIFPSLTPDELLSVIPRGPDLVQKLQIPFYLPGGIRIDDVTTIATSKSTEPFKSQVAQYSLFENEHKDRTNALLQLGKKSMDLWEEIYQAADAELKEIFKSSNFNPCKEVSKDCQNLQKGYRIDLIYNIDNAAAKAEGMKKDYVALGYAQCKLLTPEEVIAIDPFLKDFCNKYSHTDANKNLVWNNNAVALWRPGGCIDVSVFLPKLYEYLTKVMGTYTDENGNKQNNFEIKFGKKVTKLSFNDQEETVITGLEFEDGSSVSYDASSTEYVFCPGEAVGTLAKLNLAESAYAGFAGASLKLLIDIPQDQIALSEQFNHYMEVHQEGICLAWQAYKKGNQIFIGVAGTKSFYADVAPHKDEAFAKNRNLVQLNIVNNVLPEYISWALGYDTTGKMLTEKELESLEAKGIAVRWVGTRAVVYDGFPTLGHVYYLGKKVVNGRCTTHLGSGGASFAPASVWISRSCNNKDLAEDTFVQQILKYADSSRNAFDLK